MGVSATGERAGPAAPSAPLARRDGLIAISAWLVVLAGVSLRAWVTSSGFFYWDDYILQGRAWRLPLGTDLLFYDHDGHLMPGAMFFEWLVTQGFPGQYAVPVLAMIAFQAAVLTLAAAVLLTEFRRSWLILAPLALLAVTPLTLPAGTWWSSALNAMPLQCAFLGSVWAFLRWRRTRSRWAAIASIASWSLGLLFFEKSLLIPVALLGLCFVLDTSQSAWRAVVAAIRGHATYWLVTTVLVVSYVVANRLLIQTSVPAERDWALVADFIGMSGLALLTAIAGGPWHWLPVGFGSAIGTPPVWLVIGAVEGFFILFVATSILNPRALRAWAWAWGYLLLGVGVIAMARITTEVSPGITQGLRYVADASVTFALACAFALIPLRGESEPEREIKAKRWLLDRRWTAIPLTALAVIVAAGSLFSASTYRDVWTANPSRLYVSNATRSIEQASAPVIDQAVPSFVLYGLASPYNSIGWLMPPFADGYTAAQQTTDLKALDDSGLLVPALVNGPTAMPGPEDSCGWRLIPGVDTTIPLNGYVVPWKHLVRIGYISTAPSAGTLRIGDGASVPLQFQGGLGAVYAWAEGGGTSITVNGIAEGTQICTNEVAVGSLQSAEVAP